MPPPMFLLQIVHNEPPYRVARFPGGTALERDFIAACTSAIVAKGVGFFRTEAEVKEAIAAGITEVIHGLKFDTTSLA